MAARKNKVTETDEIRTDQIKDADVEPIESETDQLEDKDVESIQPEINSVEDVATFKVLHNFKDAKASEHYKKGDEIEITVKRADEINKESIEKYYEAFVERLE